MLFCLLGITIVSTFPYVEHSWLQNAKKAPNVPLGDIVRARLKQFSVMNRFKKKAMRVGNCSASFDLLSPIKIGKV